MEAIRLNSQQQIVFDELKKFISDNASNVYILNGYAGTGKTLLIQQFATYLESIEKKYLLLATTGRAAAVLKGKTKLPTSTIHSALYSFSKVDGDSEKIPNDASIDDFGQMKLIFTPVDNAAKDCIYIVDEASMLASENKSDSSFAQFGSGDLLPDLLNSIGNNKIIFVGDPCQLPPIFQPFSPALNKDWLISFGRKVKINSLNEIMRTDEGNDILVLASSIRNRIGCASHEKWVKMPAKNRKNCHVFNTKMGLVDAYLQTFKSSGPQHCIGITSSNKICYELNAFIRSRLFTTDVKLIEVGDILMVTQNNYLIPLCNGDFVKVLKVGEISFQANMKFQNIRIQNVTTREEFEIKASLDSLCNSTGNLTNDQQRLLMIDFSKRKREKGIIPNSETYKHDMQKDPYLNSLRVAYGYVVTCHKSQGGEWDDVFLFLNKSMFGFKPTDTLLKWWYTAVTRAKKNLYLHDDFWIE